MLSSPNCDEKYPFLSQINHPLHLDHQHCLQEINIDVKAILTVEFLLDSGPVQGRLSSWKLHVGLKGLEPLLSYAISFLVESNTQ
jgi:hypothetical protein